MPKKKYSNTKLKNNFKVKGEPDLYRQLSGDRWTCSFLLPLFSLKVAKEYLFGQTEELYGSQLLCGKSAKVKPGLILGQVCKW